MLNVRISQNPTLSPELMKQILELSGVDLNAPIAPAPKMLAYSRLEGTTTRQFAHVLEETAFYRSGGSGVGFQATSDLGTAQLAAVQHLGPQTMYVDLGDGNVFEIFGDVEFASVGEFLEKRDENGHVQEGVYLVVTGLTVPGEENSITFTYQGDVLKATFDVSTRDLEDKEGPRRTFDLYFTPDQVKDFENAAWFAYEES